MIAVVDGVTADVTVTGDTGTDGAAPAAGARSPRMVTLLERLDEMSAEELASAVASWNGHVGSGPNRRGLLLKISAGLALAAADPAIEHFDGDSHATATESGAVNTSLSGIWHSRYHYHSDGRNQDFDCEHYVVFKQEGDRLIGESLPATNESVLRLDLAVNGTAATGSWSERTSPTGYYHGRVYHGAIQLVIDPMGKSMTGRWVGMSRKFTVNSDTWELHWVEDASSKKTRRGYHLKA